MLRQRRGSTLADDVGASQRHRRLAVGSIRIIWANITIPVAERRNCRDRTSVRPSRMGEFGAERVAAGIEPMALHAVLIGNSCMGIEHLPCGVPGAHHRLAGLQRRHCRGMQLDMAATRLPDDNRAHQRGTVMAVDAGKLQR